MTGTEKELLASGCYQFGSHASGDVAFGPDGKLYASSGEGASFDTLDYGQYLNPCADPGNEGGSLRSQDYRSASDPLGVDGTIVKMDPDTGFTPSQATANSWLVAYGQRNPWRLTFRPGTKELWSGDVGGSEWEEVNRIPDVTQVTSPVNRGWPCYEGSFTGSLVQQGWNALDMPALREPLRRGAVGGHGAVLQLPDPRGPLLTPGEDCQNDTSSVSGIAFGSASSNYPAPVQGCDVLLRLRALVRLGAGQEAGRRPRPDGHPELRGGRRDAGGPGLRSRRRPLLRRLRPRRPGRADGERRRRAPHRLHGQQRAPDRAHRRQPRVRCRRR